MKYPTHRQLGICLVFSLCAAIWLSQPLGAAEATVERSERGAVVRVDGELFAEYLTRSGHQPAVWPIIGPTGKPMTRSYPAGPLLPGETNDHPHHPSLWFAHGDVNGSDFWTSSLETHQDNQIQHRDFVATESLGTTAKILTRNDWTHEGRKVCEDERTLLFGADANVRWIDFSVTIRASEGELTFGDTKEGTFGVRASGPLTVDSRKGARLVNSRGQVNGEAWGMFADWIDDYGPVDGETLGIAMFSHPDNFRHPTRWHARTYGLLAANPFGESQFPADSSGPKQGPVTISHDEEITLRYRVLLHRGDPVEGKVAEAYQQFIEKTDGAAN